MIRRVVEDRGDFEEEVVAVDIAAFGEVEVGRQPPARTEYHLAQHRPALEREVFKQAALVEQLKNMGEKDVDLDIADVAGARAPGHIAKLGCG